MVLSDIGAIVHDNWIHVQEHFPTVELDDFVIMPNHLHGIIILNDDRRGLINQTPTGNECDCASGRAGDELPGLASQGCVGLILIFCAPL